MAIIILYSKGLTRHALLKCSIYWWLALSLPSLPLTVVLLCAICKQCYMQSTTSSWTVAYIFVSLPNPCNWNCYFIIYGKNKGHEKYYILLLVYVVWAITSVCSMSYLHVTFCTAGVGTNYIILGSHCVGTNYIILGSHCVGQTTSF